MASFFDQVGKKVNTFGKSISDKTKELSDTTKLNGQVREEEKKIQDAFSAIGQKYYEAKKEYPDPDFTELISAIDQSKALIEDYKLQIQKIKGLCECENCGAEIEVSAKFCPKCGAKNVIQERLEAQAAEAEAAQKKTCPNCGAELEENAVFCPDCGNRVEEKAEEAPAEETPEE